MAASAFEIASCVNYGNLRSPAAKISPFTPLDRIDMTHGPDPAPRAISVALEGGGAMDAFVWGVLDRLLDEPSITIEAASGTSGGALNAALLVQGLADGGRAEAKRLLDALWERVARDLGEPDGPLGDFVQQAKIAMAPFTDSIRAMTEANKSAMTALIPGLGPSTRHPLRAVVTELLRPDVFGREGCPSLVVAATSIKTGDTKLFWGQDVTVDVLLASSCLPSKFAAIEIDGESYWDGCYTCNPPLQPLVQAATPRDVVIVRVAPRERPKIPLGEQDVQKRISEIAFGSALKHDLRAMALHQDIPGTVEGLPEAVTSLRDARLHMITAEDEFRSMNGGSIQDPSFSFLKRMRVLGQSSAAAWLSEHLGTIGTRATLDVKAYCES